MVSWKKSWHLPVVRWCFVCLLPGLLAAFVSGCDSAVSWTQERQERRLQQLEAAETIRVDELLGSFDGEICVLSPYALAVSPSGYQAQRINAYLKERGIVLMEHEWGLVVTERNEVRIAKFKRSASLDLLPAGVALANQVVDVRPDFEPRDCLPLKGAVMLKVEFRDRGYVVLGRMKP